MQRLGEAGPLQGGVVCLLKRDSLEAIDPVSGRTLWTRTDVNSRSQVFGDDQHIYVVSLDENLKASGTRVFRSYDGVTVRVRDFSNVFNSRLRLHGRTILVSEVDAKSQLTLRLYDVFQGKDVWSQKYPQGTIQLSSEDPHLAGVVEPNGTVKVYDVVQGKEVLNSKLADAAHIDKAQAIYLVSDPDYIVVAINGPADPNVPPWNGGLQPNVVTGSGLRSVPVNGEVYLFDRKTGKWRWHNPVENQHMVVSQFEDLPMVLFTARYQHLSAPPARMAMMKSTARAFAKHNGKLWYDNPNVPMVNNNPHFHALTMDHRTGKVEFTGAQLKVTMTTVPK